MTSLSIHVCRRTDALIVVDVQNDFVLPTGSLCVKSAAGIVVGINQLATAEHFGVQVLTQDWHPAGHHSFSRHGGPWPEHCVQGTLGAAFHDALDTRPYAYVIRKGMRVAHDSYSAFCDDGERETGLAALLRGMAVQRVFVAGVASDYCVRYTAEDAVKAGLKAVVLEDLTRPVDPTTYASTVRDQLAQNGVQLAKSTDLVLE